MALAAPAPANITARYDGACQRVRQVEGRVTCYSVYDASDTLNLYRRSGRRQGRLYPRLGYDAGAHRCQRGDRVGDCERNLSPAGGLGFPRPAAADFGGGFSGEDAAARKGRVRPEGLAAVCEQADAPAPGSAAMVYRAM